VEKSVIKVHMRAFNFSSSQDICTTLGVRINRLRLSKNLSQQEVALMSQSSLSSVRRLETKGQGSLEFVVRVAQALQAVEEFDDLFFQPVQTIEQAEREQALALRKRARLPKSVLKAVNR
jgi:transcriptional regulator with XRE-family HTH domain